MNLPEPEETGTTFHENAAIKALAAARAANIPALADDSGLCVDALGGAPGIYSARWADRDYPLSPRGEGAALAAGEGDKINSPSSGLRPPSPPGGRRDYDVAINRIFRELNGAHPSAEFVCVLALTQPDGETEFFEGRCRGTLIQTPRGDMGFGYDPYFVPEGYDKTFAELGAALKDKVSHRAGAFSEFIEKCLA